MENSMSRYNSTFYRAPPIHTAFIWPGRKLMELITPNGKMRPIHKQWYYDVYRAGIEQV